MRKRKLPQHDTRAKTARSRNAINQEHIIKERTDINPQGKELFDAVLRQALNTKPPKDKIIAKNEDLISMAEFARRHNVTRQRINQLMKAKDPRIKVLHTDRGTYIDISSSWTPISEQETERLPPKSYLPVITFAKSVGTTQKKIMALILKNDKRVKYVIYKGAYYVSPVSKFRPWSV